MYEAVDRKNDVRAFFSPNAQRNLHQLLAFIGLTHVFVSLSAGRGTFGIGAAGVASTQ